ncbi:hypothetical protein OAT79_00080 [Gammaproteobacteria bacterium]|nr:hypothetical protein [Gammaproteobacteria bacterium]
MKNISILNNKGNITFSLNPFPHVIIKDALPVILADQLTSEFPIHAFDTSMNNKRKDISAIKVKNTENISTLWKEFIYYHSSHDFYKEVLQIFKPCFDKNLYRSYSEFSSGVRGHDHHKDRQILLDAQISINTPVTESSSVRKAHVDNTNKLFSGLYYLKQKNDDSVGGDLEILSWNQSYTQQEKLKFYKEGVLPKHFHRNKKLKYENNIAILFLNSIDALHAVTPREPTIHSRCFVNLVGELKDDIFENKTFLKKRIYTLKEKVRLLLR